MDALFPIVLSRRVTMIDLFVSPEVDIALLSCVLLAGLVVGAVAYVAWRVW
jgi:hypothetical protein